MATYSAGVALAFTYEVADGTTGSFTPGGDNRAIFGTIACGGFFGLPSITELRHGGSSGTVITRVGSDLSWVGGNGSHGIFADAAGPTGSTTLFGDWAGNPLQSAIGAICYSGVDQTTPFSGHTDATPTFVGATTSTVASVTITGCTAGQTIVAAVGALSDGVSLSAFTAVSGTTLRVSDVTGTFVGVALLEKVATGSSETLEVNVNNSSSAGLYWTVRGARVNDAAGGGPTYTLTADSGTYSYTGTNATLAYGRVMAANGGTYSYTGTDASLLRGFNLAANGGTFSYSGGAAGLIAGRVLAANGGTFAYTGQNATLTYTPVSSYQLVADPATYAYTGQDVTFVAGRVLVAGNGAFSYVGGDASLIYSGEPPAAQTTQAGAPSAHRPYVAYINGKRVIGSLYDIQRMVEQMAEEQAEKEVVEDKKPKRVRITVQPGSEVVKTPKPSIEKVPAAMVQNDIRKAYQDAYIEAKKRLDEIEDDNALFLLL